MLGDAFRRGTAVGTGINAHPRFAKLFAQELNKLSGGKM